jgi:hypothetical protein
MPGKLSYAEEESKVVDVWREKKVQKEQKGTLRTAKQKITNRLQNIKHMQVPKPAAPILITPSGKLTAEEELSLILNLFNNGGKNSAPEQVRRTV